MCPSIQMPKIFVGSRYKGLAAVVQDLIRSKKCHWNVQTVEISCTGVLTTDGKALVEEDAEILLADVPIILDVIHTAKKLRWAASTWAGVENLIQGLDISKPLPCEITRCGGAFSELMAEYVLGYILAQERRIIEAARLQDSCVWDQTPFVCRTLRELTIGILGCGEIGSEVASLCSRVGITVIGVTRTPRVTGQNCAVSRWKLIQDLPEVLASSDYICNILPSTAETRDLLSGDTLSHCKARKSVFINIGRGDVIDDSSLVRAINEGWIGGAILDVFGTEPLPGDSPLWKLPGVRITPHVAGPSLTTKVAESFVSNFIRYCDNIENPGAAKQPLNFIVDVQRGY